MLIPNFPCKDGINLVKTCKGIGHTLILSAALAVPKGIIAAIIVPIVTLHSKGQGFSQGSGVHLFLLAAPRCVVEKIFSQVGAEWKNKKVGSTGASPLQAHLFGEPGGLISIFVAVPILGAGDRLTVHIRVTVLETILAHGHTILPHGIHSHH
jgi:ABC-type uncharacterized transport system permease subunit